MTVHGSARRLPGGSVGEHRYVREAFGQLLDYADDGPEPIRRLTALFPGPPAPGDIRLLNIYGVDCLYWAGSDTFPRLEARPKPES